MHFESFHFNYNPNNHYYFLTDVSEFSADFLIIADGRFLSLYNFQVSVITFGYTGGNGSGVQQKQFQRLLKSRHCCFHTKAFDNVYEKYRKQISTTRKLTTKLCCTQNLGSRCIEAEKSTNPNWSTNNWRSEKSSIDSLWTAGWCFCQIMNIFNSGYGNLEIGSDVLCVRFLYDEKIKIWKKIIFNIS